MNQATTKQLLEHLQLGGSTDKDTVAGICDVTNRSIKTMEKYLDACAEEDELLEGVALGEPTAYYEDPDEEGGTPDANNKGDEGDEGEPGDEEDEDEDDSDEEESDDSDDSDDEDEEEEVEQTPPPETPSVPSKPKTKKDYRFFFERADGTSIELERISSKSGGSVVTFHEKSISDIVTVMLKGKPVEIDIIPLRKAKPSATSEHGISNELLLNLALAAK